MSPPADRFQPFGTHLMDIDGDSIFLKVRGQLTLDDMHALLDTFVRIRKEHGLLFVIYDGWESTGIDPAARRLASHGRSNDADAHLRVAFGVPFTVRVILNMIVRAQKVLTNRDVAVRIFDTEKHAWEFFVKERQRIRENFKKSIEVRD